MRTSRQRLKSNTFSSLSCPDMIVVRKVWRVRDAGDADLAFASRHFGQRAPLQSSVIDTYKHVAWPTRPAKPEYQQQDFWAKVPASAALVRATSAVHMLDFMLGRSAVFTADPIGLAP